MIKIKLKFSNDFHGSLLGEYVLSISSLIESFEAFEAYCVYSQLIMRAILAFTSSIVAHSVH